MFKRKRWLSFALCFVLLLGILPLAASAESNHLTVQFSEEETALTDVYFEGTKEAWNAIQIGENNGPLLKAAIHYLGETYTATFLVDGEVYQTEEFTATQESIHEPAVPEKPGYTGAWSRYILSAQDITIEAIYTPITYTVTFVADGTPVQKLPYTVETVTFALPPVPEKAGYTGKWEPFVFDYADVTVNAVYEPNVYTATLIADGETVAEIPFAYGQKSISLPKVPQKEGHTGAWPAYSLGAEDITIEAVYTPNLHTVTYVVDGNPWASGEIAYGEAVWQPRTPEKEGCAFTGWTPKIPASMPDEDLTFYAVFEQTEFTLRLMADDVLIAETAVRRETPIRLTVTTGKPGYTFLGWAETPDAAVAAYLPQNEYVFHADTTLYAVWQKNAPATPPTVKIRNYVPECTVDYKTSVTFTAEINLPNGTEPCLLVWYINEKPKDATVTCTVSQATEDFTVQAKLVNERNQVLAESGVETVHVRNGFFARVIAFVRSLFNRLPVLSQTLYPPKESR